MNSMLPFFQITLPIMVTFIATIWLASWMQNKRLDDIVARLSAIEARLLAVEKALGALTERVVRLEERISPFAKTGKN